jgi:hypothetical protein
MATGGEQALLDWQQHAWLALEHHGPGALGQWGEVVKLSQAAFLCHDVLGLLLVLVAWCMVSPQLVQPLACAPPAGELEACRAAQASSRHSVQQLPFTHLYP